MNIVRDKSKLSTIALILLLAVSAILVALPAVSAQTQSKATICYLGAMPNPVGVNQPVLLHVGITDSRSSVELGWEGMTITVVDPEGVESTIQVPKTDATGGTGVAFTPDKVGNYTLQAHFPTQTITVAPFMFGEPYNLTYLASDSPPVELQVLSEPIEYYPGHSLPSNYWTRPIDAQLREWSVISGSWQYIPRNFYAPYNEYAPETAHVLWTKPLTSGGLVGGGGAMYGRSFEIGDAYEGKFTGSNFLGFYGFDSRSIILAGNLYYQESTLENPVLYHCVDLHTGEELWAKTFLDNRTIDFGQLFYWDEFNMHGCFAYLWVASGSDYYVFDAYSGDWVFTVENVPSGTKLMDDFNHLYILNVNTNAGWMAMWNMTALGLTTAGFFGEGSWGDAVHMNTYDGSNPAAWTLNVTIPAGLPGSVIAAEFGDRVIGGDVVGDESVSLWGLNLNSTGGAIGTELFSNTMQSPAYWAELNLTVAGMFGDNWVAVSFEDRVAVLWGKETREHFGFSLETGKMIWGPTPRQYYLDALDDTPQSSRAVAYGKLYSASVGGIVYCYDIQTGEPEWTYEVSDPYSEFLFANNWWVKPTFVTDGKLYVGHLEHSPVDPRPRGGPFVCLNATTGDVIWRVNGMFRQTRWGGRAVLGDSIIATMDTYDQRVYAIGKGSSLTTVTASPKIVAKDHSIVIEGTVMDVSPGTKDINLQLRFPNGVPAISDESMSDWMLYIYKQFEIPANATGVEVVFNAVNSTGHWLDIDRTKTDMTGKFSYIWNPDKEGKYTIVATFMGSDGYYASCAETTVLVGASEGHLPTADEIASATASKLPTASAIADETISRMPAFLTIDMVILILAAIGVIIGLIAYMTLRKQK
jgi:outer membrane protein assembly factor BamB